MNYLASLMPMLWVCIEDFNEILTPLEKWGGRGQPSHQMKAFQQALEVCELYDLGYRGSKLMWSNYQDGLDFIKKWLDHGVANLEWSVLFLNTIF
jgi:hypothetical protein